MRDSYIVKFVHAAGATSNGSHPPAFETVSVSAVFDKMLHNAPAPVQLDKYT